MWESNSGSLIETAETVRSESISSDCDCGGTDEAAAAAAATGLAAAAAVNKDELAAAV